VEPVRNDREEMNMMRSIIRWIVIGLIFVAGAWLATFPAGAASKQGDVTQREKLRTRSDRAAPSVRELPMIYSQLLTFQSSS
jgi:hypothetical protein